MCCVLTGMGRAQMLESLQAVRQDSGTVWSLFGDSAFALSIHLQRMLRGAAARSEAGKRYNRRMASVRISIENAFAELLNRSLPHPTPPTLSLLAGG
jgi:hypothetical protein